MANDNTYIDYEKWAPEGGKRIAYNTSIVGMRYRQSAANAAFRWGKTPDFRFCAELDNPYDGNAVAVIADGKHIGYLPEEVAEKVTQKQYPLDQLVFQLQTLRRTEGDVSGLYGNLWLLSEPVTQPKPEPQSDTLPLPDELSTIPTAVKLPSINPQTGAVIALIAAVPLPIIGGAVIGFAGIVIGLLVGIAIIIAAALRAFCEDKKQ